MFYGDGQLLNKHSVLQKNSALFVRQLAVSVILCVEVMEDNSTHFIDVQTKTQRVQIGHKACK